MRGDKKIVAREFFDKDGHLIKTIGKIPDGLCKQYDEHNKLWAEINYKKGKYHGTRKSFFESGRIEYILRCKNGKKEGKSEWYYEDGKLRAKWNYKDGKFHGIQKWYYKNGKLKIKSLYDNDKLKKERFFRNSIRNKLKK